MNDIFKRYNWTQPRLKKPGNPPQLLAALLAPSFCAVYISEFRHTNTPSILSCEDEDEDKSSKVKTMMMGEPTRLFPTLRISDWEWDPSDDSPGAPPPSPFPIKFNGNAAGCDYSHSIDSSVVLQCSLSNDFTPVDLDTLGEEFHMPIGAFSSDHFRMFEFKIRKCPRGRSHDWTECPYAHPGEKARRRDPRKFHYSGTACPEFRQGNCKKGDSCEFAHGVFECWLHPTRYRTQLCKDLTNCRRRVCFFAHTPEQLRVLTPGSGESSDGSPIRWSKTSFISSPTSVLNLSPISPLPDSSPALPGNPQYGCGSFNAVGELVTSMRNVQLDKAPSTRGSQMSSGFGSRPGFFSLPSTPTSVESTADFWDRSHEEEPPMERVESGRDLRAKIYAKLSKENSFGVSETGVSAPDFGWVSELVK